MRGRSGEEGGRIVAQGTPEAGGSSEKVVYGAGTGRIFCGEREAERVVDMRPLLLMCTHLCIMDSSRHG
jgi:hypothetical protein